MRKSFYNVRMRRSQAIILDLWDIREISRFREEISGFHVRFQDFTKDFKISRRFQDFTKDFKISRKISLEVYEISASGEPLALAQPTIAIEISAHAYNKCQGKVFIL